MKTLLLIVAAFTLLFQTGCVSSNADHATNAAAPAFVISPALSNATATVQALLPAAQTILSATPAAPAAPFLPTAANTILAALFAASAWYAKRKSDAAQSHSDAAAALAATVVSLNSAAVPAIGTAISNATANGSSAAVAVHLANANNPVQL
jgi:hypothetical protein